MLRLNHHAKVLQTDAVCFGTAPVNATCLKQWQADSCYPNPTAHLGETFIWKFSQRTGPAPA